MFEDLKNKFNIQEKDNRFYVDRNEIHAILKYLKTNENYLFERLDTLYANDTGENIEINYILHSDKYNTKCTITAKLSYEDEIDSITEIFKSANYDEREVFDLFGINFINHPNLKRILLPDSFLGYPLRKDYKMQDERLRWNYE